MPAPTYHRIEAFLRERIESGEWREGDRVPSEPELARRFRVARMTVNRAVRELAGEGLLRRVRGSGTFVAPPRRESTLVEIRSIADEIRGRGGAHRADVLRQERVAAEPPVALALGLDPGAPVFHARLVHREDERPVQVEERWVSPAAAPGFLAHDFSGTTPSEVLLRAAPLERVEYAIEAREASPEIREALELGPAEPALLLHRRTFSRGRAASVVDLWHPGGRYRLTGHF